MGVLSFLPNGMIFRKFFCSSGIFVYSKIVIGQIISKDSNKIDYQEIWDLYGLEIIFDKKKILNVWPFINFGNCV